MVGVVANPVSAHDIRRITANAGSLQIADRANIVLRVLAGLAAAGVRTVLVMPDRKGITALLERNLARERNLGRSLPEVRILALAVTTTVDDTLRATAAMVDAGVAAIVVLGGDGTHRAVVRRCGKIPLAGLSTGTNNTFPEMREPTITGLATGLYASGAVPPEEALLSNKVLEVSVNDGERELELRAGDRLTVTLRCDAFRSIDVPGCMRVAALRGLFHHNHDERGSHG
jgi:predicted polyphosphate/ATP-dependent NAD kinase